MDQCGQLRKCSRQHYVVDLCTAFVGHGFVRFVC